MTAPSILLSAVRYGRARTEYQRPSRAWTSRSWDGQRLHHFPEERFKMRDVDAEPEVSDRPPDVAGGHLEDPFRDRGHATDAEIGPHHDDGDMGAREEIAEVVAELDQLDVAAVQLVVHRGQLFVRSLELLLGRLQLLVGALQLLVARLRLLGGGTQLFHGRLVLFANGLQMLVRVGKLPGELGHSTLARYLRSRPAVASRCGRGALGALLEE